MTPFDKLKLRMRDLLLFTQPNRIDPHIHLKPSEWIDLKTDPVFRTVLERVETSPDYRLERFLFGGVTVHLPENRR